MHDGGDAQASSDVTEGLRARDPREMAAFLDIWASAVERYCRTVCAPELVDEAIGIAFADFLDKVDTHPIADEHLEAALMRSTRLTAAEAARIDWDTPSAPAEPGEEPFDCELTPLYMAGSPRAPASVAAITQMDEHVVACPRCQAGAQRFSTAEEGFPGWRGKQASSEVMDALFERLAIERLVEEPEPEAEAEEPEPEPEPEAERPLEPDFVQPSEADLEAESGETIAGFRIITAGSADEDGVVSYIALDDNGQRVALRLVPTGSDAAFKKRFLRDARLLAELSHSSLPSVRAVGEAPEGAYVVSDETHSRTLASVMERGLPDKQAILMLGEVANAIDSAHSAGLLHRQIRPANLVVGEWLIVRPLLVNFALGRKAVDGDEQVPYMSPELLEGGAADAASDRYALACTIYELLGGEPPFGSVGGREAGRRRANPPPRLDGFPEEVNAALARALAPVSRKRPASAAELMAELGRAFSTPSAPGPEPEAEAAEAEPESAEPEAEAAEREPEPEPGPEPKAVGSGPKAVEPEPKAVESEPKGAEPPPRRVEPARARVKADDEAGGSGGGIPGKLLGVGAALVAALVIAVVVLMSGSSDDDGSDAENPPPPAANTEATSEPQERPPPPAIVPVPRDGVKSVDFDPNGGNGENPELAGRVFDGNPRTAWETELYPTGTFGSGVGVYVALPRPYALRTLTLRTSTPGWDAEIYGATAGPPAELPAPGWTRLGGRAKVRPSERIGLTGARGPIRFCLVWIKTLPPGGLVSIGEIGLLADR